MKILTKEQVLRLHTHLIEETGGTDGLRDVTLLESALSAPFQSFAGQEVFPSVLHKAARLGLGLIKNHPFLDGNKRIGTHTMLVFLAVNGIEINCEQQELADTIINVASSRISFEMFCDWLEKKHSDFKN